MSGSRKNSWGDPIRLSQTLAAGQEYPGPSPHAEMSWTVCYDDDCEIHLCEKQGSGWFPRRKYGKGPKRGKGKGKGTRRALDEDDPENKPWGDSGDGGGCPIPTEEEVKAILARKAAREAEEAKAAAGVNNAVQIGREEEEAAKPNTETTQGMKPKATAEVKSDWAEKIRELLAGGVKADGGVRLNTAKHTNNSAGRSLAEAVVKPVPSAGNPTPAVAKYGSRSGKGQLVAPPNRSTIASVNLNSGFRKEQFAPPVKTAPAPAKFNPALEKKLFTSQPIATAKTPQKTHFTYPHSITGPAVHNPTIDKKRFTSPPVATIHAPGIFDPQLEKKQFASPPTTNHHQKQPLQPRKDQGRTNPYPKPSKMSHQNSPVTTVPTAVIAARVAAKAKLAAEREEKHPQMVKYKQLISAGTGVV